jgi:CheY-like chemotaxis protein
MKEKKILVVEPDPTNAPVIMKLLEVNEITSVLVSSGTKAIVAMKENKYDLILSEMDLPDMPAMQLLKHVRENEATFYTPFIFISEWPDETKIRMAMINGADDYLSKPISIYDLINTIQARLNIHEQRLAYNTRELNNKWLDLINVNFNHEFLTPLNGILSSISLLENYPDRDLNIPECKELLNAILVSGTRMIRNTRNLIMFSIINKADNELRNTCQPELMMLNDFMDAVIKQVTNMSLNQNNLIKVTMPDYLNFTIPRLCMSVIVEELLDNAIKYNADTANPAECVITQTGHELIFKISNKVKEGQDFDLSDVKPFKKFHRDLSLNGFGLGLYVAKEIAASLAMILTLEKVEDTLHFLLSVPYAFTPNAKNYS